MGYTHNTGFETAVNQVLPGRMYAVFQHCEKMPQQSEVVLYTKGNGHTYARFMAQSLPGCCGVLVLYYVEGYGRTQQTTLKRAVDCVDVVCKAAKRAKYGCVLMTQRVDSAIVAVLPQELWRSAPVFVNGKTDRKLVMLYHLIDYVAPPPRVAAITASE